MPAKGGTSTEFADYRDYVAGDDVRYVDWNIFARLERPYVKLYRHEEEMHVVSIVDASSSMQFDGKFERARQLAAAFGLMGLMNVERVSSFVCNHVGQRAAVSAPLHRARQPPAAVRFSGEDRGGRRLPHRPGGRGGAPPASRPRNRRASSPIF